MKMLNRIHLNGLRAVETAGRLGSLQRAAEELGVSVGAVSQQIIRAERMLGRTVFTRLPRGLAPTAFGRGFLERLHAGFRTLDDTVGSAFAGPADSLNISVAPVFASRWLVPRLSRFGRLHPDIRVRLEASVRLVDPDADDVDIAIRVGDGNWPGVRLDFLLAQEVFPVCAPALAQGLHHPRDLMRLPVVRDMNSNLSWQSWLDPFGLSEDDLMSGNSFTDASLALDAAIDGQGVMLAWHTLAAYQLKAGTLVAPFPERAVTGLGYWLVSSARRRDDARIAAFRRWIRQEMADSAGENTRLATAAAPSVLSSDR